MNKYLKNYFYNTISIYENFIEEPATLVLLKNFEKKIIKTKNNNKTFIFGGNGGSYADALHFSAELTGSLINRTRQPIKSFVLGANASSLTAISNDYSYKTALAREIYPYSKKDFLLILFSTSGRSENVLKLIESSSIDKTNTFIFTGNNFSKDLNKINIFSFNSNQTSHIQECYKIFLHSVLIKNNF